MRRLRWSAALLAIAILRASPAAAQQGSLQLSATSQVLTGGEARIAGQNRVEPDVGITWFQPGLRVGTFEIDAHLIQRDKSPQLGRTFVGLRDVRLKGLTWTFQAGDTSALPSVSDYSFSNLFAPRLNFAGAYAQGLSPKTSVTISAGRTAALRNIFGTDTEVLDQDVAFVKARHRSSTAFEFSVRASGVRTRDLGEFTYFIGESRQAGGGVRYRPVGLVEIVADAAYTSFRRRGVDRVEQDASGLAGTLWALPKGWVQLNAQRFSPGEFPVLHNSLTDRQGVFAAGEYDLTSRVRAFGGLDGYLTNLDPETSALADVAQPRSRVVRGFGGVRTRLGNRTFVTLRLEDGSRASQPVKLGRKSESDTGLLGGEWQGSFGKWSTFARYQRRSNAEVASLGGTFTQHDGAAQVYFNPSRGSQIFGLLQFTRRNDRQGGGQDFWQVTGGGQIQIPRRNLWLRAEGTATETLDFDTAFASERQALTVGFFGQISNRTSLAFDLYVDRSPIAFLEGSPWTTRSTIRFVHAIPTGSARVGAAGSATTVGRRPARGAGAIAGQIFADWNGNGARDEGEEPLGGITLAVGSLAKVASGGDGQFHFAQVPVGLQKVGLDVTALPVDYDVPKASQIDIDIERDKTARVSFGLVPLGSVQGGVYRDANGSGKVDEGDEPIDGAVLVLDQGARSELARGGAFRFDATSAGRHVLRLLADSLPASAEIQGPAEIVVELTRADMSPRVAFLIKLEQRPEIRRVFPPAAVAAPSPAPPARPASPTPTAPARPPAPPTPHREAPAPTPPAAAPTVTAVTSAVAIQIAAVTRIERARSMVEDLRARGFDAYILPPSAGARDEFYRVRVGTYASREIAQQVISALNTALSLQAGFAPEDAAAVTPFRIQVAAVRDSDQARALADRLTQAGYPAYVLAPGPVNADALYRVRAGTYPTREDAERAAGAIEQDLGSKVWITREQPAPRPPAARRAPTAAAPPLRGPLTIQLAAFGEAERAQDLATRLRQLGYAPIVLSPAAGSPDALHRVRLGAYASRDEAQRAIEAIAKALGVRGWIIAGRPGAAPAAPVAPRLTPVPRQAPAGPFVIQVAALSDAERVPALVDRLRQMGYATYVDAPRPGATDTLHRVGAGPFVNLDEARAAAAAIEKALGVKVWIRPERPQGL